MYSFYILVLLLNAANDDDDICNVSVIHRDTLLMAARHAIAYSLGVRVEDEFPEAFPQEEEPVESESLLNTNDDEFGNYQEASSASDESSYSDSDEEEFDSDSDELAEEEELLAAMMNK